MPSTARSVSALSTAKQMVCSEDACEMRMTFTRREARVRNKRSAMPGTPTIPAPRSVSSERSPIDVMPFARPSPSALRLEEMSVPGAAGLKVFLIKMGMRLATAGAMVAEWSTFAPK